MDLGTVMTEISTQVDTISGLRCFDYPPDRISPPAAVVAYPDTLTFDETYGRGMDRMTLRLVVVVGKVTDRSSKKALAAYCNGSGSSSIKAVVEAGTYTSFDTVRVASIDFDVVTIAATDYVAATFSLDIAGSGA